MSNQRDSVCKYNAIICLCNRKSKKKISENFYCQLAILIFFCLAL